MSELNSIGWDAPNRDSVGFLCNSNPEAHRVMNGSKFHQESANSRTSPKSSINEGFRKTPQRAWANSDTRLVRN